MRHIDNILAYGIVAYDMRTTEAVLLVAIGAAIFLAGCGLWLRSTADYRADLIDADVLVHHKHKIVIALVRNNLDSIEHIAVLKGLLNDCTRRSTRGELLNQATIDTPTEDINQWKPLDYTRQTAQLSSP